MRLPKFEPPPPPNSGGLFARAHVSTYFKRYLLHPATQILSEKICEASRVVLNKVNKRVNVEVLTVTNANWDCFLIKLYPKLYFSLSPFPSSSVRESLPGWTDLLCRLLVAHGKDLLLRRAEQTSAPEDIKLLKHILQMTNEQTPFETLYYVEESNKVHVTELFDISDCEDTNLQTETERELNQLLEFDIDDWGDADFGYGASGWEDNMSDELFPDDEEETRRADETMSNSSNEIGDNLYTTAAGSYRSSTDDVLERIRGALPSPDAVRDDGDEEEQDDVDDDPYVFSNLATTTTSKAMNMSQEYNEILFGTFRHSDEEDEEQEEILAKVAPKTDKEVTETVAKIGDI